MTDPLATLTTSRAVRLRLGSVVVGSVLTLLVAGCGSGGGTSGADPSTDPSTSAGTTPPNTSPPTPKPSHKPTHHRRHHPVQTVAADPTVQRAWVGTLDGVVAAKGTPRVAAAPGLAAKVAELRSAVRGHKVEFAFTHPTVHGRRGTATLVMTIDGRRQPPTTVDFTEQSSGWQLTYASFCRTIAYATLSC